MRNKLPAAHKRPTTFGSRAGEQDHRRQTARKVNAAQSGGGAAAPLKTAYKACGRHGWRQSEG